MHRATTATIYSRYDRLIRVIEAWVATRDLQLSGCEPSQVRARVVQRIVQLGEGPYCRQAATTDAAEGAVPPSTLVHVDGLVIDSGSGRVRLSWRQWGTHLALFVFTWGRSLLQLVTCAVRRAPDATGPATLLLESAAEIEESDEQFVAFCARGPVGVLTSASRIIVRRATPPRRQTSSRVRYADDPVVALVAGQDTGQRIRCLLAHLSAPVGLLVALCRDPLMVLISRDLALLPLVRRLDSLGLVEAMVATTSSFQQQTLWAKGLSERRFKLHMIWYSQNFIPKMYQGDEERQSLPSARHMRVDENWVWTQGFADYLQGLGGAAVNHVVGPILWYLPEPSTASPQKGVRIAVFDITPLPDGAAPFGAARNYYSVRGMKTFVRDIVDIALELERELGEPVQVLLKHKRMVQTGFHDSDYVQWLDDLGRSTPQFRLVDHRTNLYTLLGDAAFSVSVPYTSTVCVSAALGRPAIYYDFTGELIPAYESSPHVCFVQDRAALGRAMRASVAAGRGRAAAAGIHFTRGAL